MLPETRLLACNEHMTTIGVRISFKSDKKGLLIAAAGALTIGAILSLGSIFYRFKKVRVRSGRRPVLLEASSRLANLRNDGSRSRVALRLNQPPLGGPMSPGSEQ